MEAEDCFLAEQPIISHNVNVHCCQFLDQGSATPRNGARSSNTKTKAGTYTRTDCHDRDMALSYNASEPPCSSRHSKRPRNTSTCVLRTSSLVSSIHHESRDIRTKPEWRSRQRLDPPRRLLGFRHLRFNHHSSANMDPITPDTQSGNR
jgi:hypothetical protein